MKSTATQQGMTLIECMIALTLGMLVILASTALFLSAQKTYLAIDDSARIGDTGAFAMDALAAAIRQAAYADHSGAGTVSPPKPPGQTLFGLDDTTLIGRSLYPDQRRGRGINGSDVLFTRFMATDSAGAIDRNMLNCAGSHSARKASMPVSAEAIYNWSIFYIALDTGGEPELFCKYRAKNDKFRADAIARGVESMQFLYGVDLNQDGLPDTFLNADAIAASDWRKVVAVDIALSVHGHSRGAESKIGRSRSSRLFHRTIILRNHPYAP
jgi:type IV pilus assembly protein PilW